MEDAVAVLQAANHSRSAADPVTRRQADQWLQAWRSTPGSWKTSLLLLQPKVMVTDMDRYFFACCLRFACESLNGGILEYSMLGQLLDQMSAALLASVWRGTNAVSSHLGAALAALALRTQSWEPSRLIPDFVTLFQRQGQVMQGLQEPACLPADLVSVVALLQVLQSLASEARNKLCACHPSRRAAVISALSTSPEPVRWVRLALAVQGPSAVIAGTQAVSLIEEWCQLGFAPQGLESHDDVLAALCQKCLAPETCKATADCLSALFALCGPQGAKPTPPAPQPANTSSSGLRQSSSSNLGVSTSSTPVGDSPNNGPSNPKLLHALLQHWKATGYPLTMPGSLNRPVARPSSDGFSDLSVYPPAFRHMGNDVMLAACKVLCSASCVLLSHAVPGSPAVTPASSEKETSGGSTSSEAVQPQGPTPQAVQQQQQQAPQHQQQQQQQHADPAFPGYNHYFMLVAQQLLLHLQHCEDQVALIAADFFSGTYLPALKALPINSLQRQALLLKHATLLKHLTESLVLRTQLKPEVAAVATADARDIPDEARTVRRELAGMLRDISSMVGHTVMLEFMAALVQQGYQRLVAGSSQGGGGQSWVRIECALYAANVVTGRWVAESLHGRSCSKQPPSRQQSKSELVVDASDTEAGKPEAENTEEADSDDDEQDRASVSTAVSGDALSSSSSRPYPAASAPAAGDGNGNGKVGKVCVKADAAIRQLVEVAALSSVHPNGSSKLAGTALTLLGGLATWYASRTVLSGPVRRQPSSLLQFRGLIEESRYSRSHSSPVDEENTGAVRVASDSAVAYARSQSSPLQDGEKALPSPLPSVLLAVLHSLKSDDAKLSRNGATTLQRLCAHEGLARHLLACHLSWVDMLVGVYQERGGMQQRAGPHEDSSTEELLLVTLCRLACLSSGTKQLLLHLAAPQVQQVQQALAELAAARDAAAAPGSVGTLFGAAAGLTCATLVSQCSRSLEVLTAIMESCKAGRSCSDKKTGNKELGQLAGIFNEGSSCAATQEQVLGLMRAAWLVLEDGLKPELLQTNGNSEVAAAVAAFMAAAMLRLLPAAPGSSSSGTQQQKEKEQPMSVSAVLMEPLSWALTVLEAIPVLMLSKPKIADLLLTSMEANALLQKPSSIEDMAATMAALEGDALTTRLATVAGGAVVAGCANLVDQVSGPQMDSSHITLLLRICHSCMSTLPSCLVLWQSTPDLLLSATLVACYSHDMDQCRAAMDWAQKLCTAPFAPNPTASLADTAAYAQLRTWLDGTSGAQVVQALLLASAGSMPSCLILPLATVLHHIWRGVGTERFLRWSDMALIMMTPNPPAPWQDLKPEHRSAFLHELVSPECVDDVPRFKRVVKALCGGKRKGEGPGTRNSLSQDLPLRIGSPRVATRRYAARRAVSSYQLGQTERAISQLSLQSRTYANLGILANRTSGHGGLSGMSGPGPSHPQQDQPFNNFVNAAMGARGQHGMGPGMVSGLLPPQPQAAGMHQAPRQFTHLPRQMPPPPLPMGLNLGQYGGLGMPGMGQFGGPQMGQQMPGQHGSNQNMLDKSQQPPGRR